jgi:hypothetical protein
MDLSGKLNLVCSPSDSKPLSLTSENSSSIPPPHREYEKMLRHLEAECRVHVKNE